MPVPKGAVRRNPMQVRESQKFMFAAINVVLGSIGFSIYGLYYYLQKRSRAASDAAAERLLEDGSGNRRAAGSPLAAIDAAAPRRVIIAGASAAGATAAAMLTKGDPSLEVIVFDKERRVMLSVMAPYAQAGHRSYDLTTSGAPETLSSPTTWTTTRDATLIPKGIERVVPERNVVVDTDGIEHSYDALIVASGSEREVDGCGVKGLTEATIDRHRVCESPHITRDTLQTVWEGNVICAKVSTRYPSYRRRIAAAAQAGGTTAVDPAVAKEMKGVAKSLDAMRRENEKMRALAALSSPAAVAAASLTASSSSSPSWANQHFSSAYCAPNGPLTFDRGCDVAFVSSVNVLWKFLSHFGKLQRMPVSVYADEAGPCEGLGHSDYTRSILGLWGRRSIPFYGGQRLVEIDVLNGEATFESVSSAAPSRLEFVRTKVPYKLLFLDLPRRPPAYIAASGLSTAEADGFVAVDPNTLQHPHHRNIFAIGDCAALPTLKSYGAVFTQVPVVAHNIIQYLNHVKRLPPADAMALAEGCATPYTVTTTTVTAPAAPPAAVEGLEGDAKKKAAPRPEVVTTVTAGPKRTPQAAAAERARIYSAIPLPSASYDGYSSAPVVMTTWRSMWPERRYSAAEVRRVVANGYEYPQHMKVAAGAGADGGEGSAARVNCHKWDNTEWEGLRGLLNGVYLQLFGYEVMYWFVFMRGHWHPPTWWRGPKFPLGADGVDYDAVPTFDRGDAGSATPQ